MMGCVPQPPSRNRRASFPSRWLGRETGSQSFPLTRDTSGKRAGCNIPLTTYHLSLFISTQVSIGMKYNIYVNRIDIILILYIYIQTRTSTRCGPFDKIGFWSLFMPFWDHQSLVSKETIFRRCTYFSDFCNYWKTFSDDNSQKIGWQSDSWERWNVSF